MNSDSSDSTDLLLGAEPIANDQGRPPRLPAARDLTESRRLEREMVRIREKLDAALATDQAKTEFLSRMSHELRAPLNAVSSFARRMSSDEAESKAPGKRQQLERIVEAGWHLLALADDVLDLSLIEAGRLALSPLNIDLVALIEDVLQMMRPLTQRRKVNIDRDFEAGGNFIGTGDPVRLRQVLHNVLSNAVKYNRPDGWLFIELEQEDDHILVRISDTGIGMDHAQLARLFEPFDRLGRDRGPAAGVAIGLTLPRELMRLMGGEIEVTSEAGIGTTVQLALPAAPDAGMPGAPRADVPGHASAQRTARDA
jgi:signal transduction histidine kinase